MRERERSDLKREMMALQKKSVRQLLMCVVRKTSTVLELLQMALLLRSMGF